MKEISKTLATEMYKTLKSLSPEIIKDIFKTKNNHYNTLNVLIFPKEMLKQLDMDYRPCLKWVLWFWTLYPKSLRNGVLFVLAWVAWVACLRWWRASVGGALLSLLLLLKYYPEDKNVEYLLLKQKWKMNSDLKEEPDLKSRHWFALFDTVTMS